jgi:hypothetical protein
MDEDEVKTGTATGTTTGAAVAPAKSKRLDYAGDPLFTTINDAAAGLTKGEIVDALTRAGLSLFQHNETAEVAVGWANAPV